MWWMLLAIIGCYAFAVLLARMAARCWPRWRDRTHVVLLAGNQGDRIEWYLRRLRRWSLRTGRDVRVTLVDCGSTDDTAAIAERFGRGTGAVNVVHMRMAAGEAGCGPADSAALKASLCRRSGAAFIASIGGGSGEGCEDEFDGRVGGVFSVAADGGGGGVLLVDLNDPADVARLP